MMKFSDSNSDINQSYIFIVAVWAVHFLNKPLDLGVDGFTFV